MTFTPRVFVSTPTWRMLLRLAIIAATLGAAFVLGMSAGSRLTLLAPALIAIIIYLRVPELGLLTIVAASIAFPFTLSTGSESRIHLAVLLIPGLTAMWCGEMLLRRRFSLHSSPVYLPLFLFMASATLSLIAGGVLWNSFYGLAPITAQLGGWAMFVFSALMLLLAAERIGSLRWLQRLVLVFCALGVVVFLSRVLPSLSLIVDRFVPTGAQGSILWIWLVSLPAGQALFNSRLRPGARLALGAIALAIVARAYLLEASWASGWMPALAALAILLVLRSWRSGLAISLVAFLLLNETGASMLTTLVQGDQYSVETRTVAWSLLLNNIFPANPLLGLGPANYYYDTHLFPFWGYYISFNSHNQYIDILAQTGLVGMVVFLWLMASLARVGWQTFNRTGGFSRGYAAAAVAAIGATLLAGMLGDWFIPFVYNIGLAGFRSSLLGWLLLGGLLAVARLAGQEQGQT